MKMNNKGQSLVSFVLIIPIIFLLFVMVYDIGSMTLLKHELDDINCLVIDYGIDKINDENIQEELREIIIKNKNDIDKIEINILDDKINILLEDTIDTKISLLKHVFKVKSSYLGYMDQGKKIIERNK